MDETMFNKNEIITTKDINQLNISKTTFYKYIDKYQFVKISHGVYVKKDALIDPLVIVLKRCSKIVFSHEEALFYYGLIDYEPSKISFTIYSGYNKTRLKSSDYKVFSVKKDLLDIGKIFVKDHFGNIIPIYDLERTICDLIRSRSYFEKETFNKAIKAYIKRKDKDLGKLFEYAKKFHVDKILRNYLEVLL